MEATRTTPLIIGLSGATNSGKGTVSGILQNKYQGLTIIHMDDYFWPEHDSHHIMLAEYNYSHANWDVVSSVDFDRMICDVKQWMKRHQAGDETCSVLIIEGIMVLNKKELADLCTKKYFITLEKDLCWERRRKRDYDPPDPPGYFEKIAWPEYVKYKNELEELETDILFIDGRATIAELSSLILNDVESFLK